MGWEPQCSHDSSILHPLAKTLHFHILPHAYIHSVHFIHLASSCWSLAYSPSQAQSIFISVNDFKMSHSYMDTYTCLRCDRKVETSCVKAQCYTELYMASLPHLRSTCTWCDVQVWRTVLWLRREHQMTYTMVVVWHYSLLLTVRLIPREAGPALNISHLDFYPQKGRQCLRWMHRGKAYFSLITEGKLLSAAALVGLETKQSVTCISALHFFFRLSHLWFTEGKNLSEPWNVNHFLASRGFSCNILTNPKGRRKACGEKRQWTCPL